MKKTIKIILTGILTALAGYGLMVFPFHIFEFLTPFQMKLIFIAELIIYFSILAGVGITFEAKKDRKRKNDEMQKRHNERIKRKNEEYQGIHIPDFDFVA